jgi:hypothetical protein
MSANSVFERYEYKFDTNKFGGAINISDDAKNMLNASSNNITFKSWQITDLANGPVNRETYYKNPVKNVTSNLISTVNSFGSSMLGVTFTSPGAQEIVNSIMGTSANSSQFLSNANNVIAVTMLLSDFISHTNNVSGVSANTATELSPTFDAVMSYGNENTFMLNKTDGIANAVGGLGAMTSLFIGDEISSNVTTFNYYTNLIISNTTSTYGGLPPAWSNTCSLSASQMQTMNVSFRGLYNQIYSRIDDDWTFYQATIQVGRDYGFLSRFSQLSNTQTYLINNLVGTDYLKSKIIT